MNSYKDLKVYEKSYEIAKVMYTEVTKKLPIEERFGLISQVKRAATSIPLNIAEGYGKRAGDKELVRFLLMANGSASEMEVLLDFLYDFGYITVEEHCEYRKEYEEIGKMLTGLIKSLKVQP